MTDEHVNSLRVSTIGMNQQSINILHMFFRCTCMNNYVLADENNADISIVDLDSYESKQAWIVYREKYPNRPTILKSINETHSDNTLFVRKPINSKILKNVLHKAKMQLQTSTDSNLPVSLFSNETLPNETVPIGAVPIETVSVETRDQEESGSSLEFRALIPTDTIHENTILQKNTLRKKVELGEELNFIEELVEAKSARHSLCFVEKIRQIDNGNLAVNNITQLITGEETIYNGKTNVNVALNLKPKIQPNLSLIDPVKEINKMIKSEKISRIGPNNDLPVAKIDVISPRIIFDEVTNKYITEANNNNLVEESSSLIPVLNDRLLFDIEDTNTSPLESVFIEPISKGRMKKTEKLNIASKRNNIISEVKNKGLFYNPSHYLQGYLKEAFKLAQNNRRNVQLKGVLQSIFILYQTREIFVTRNRQSQFAMSERYLFAISSIPIEKNNMETTILADSYDEIVNEEGLLLNYDSFMWTLATRASRGRLPEGTILSRQIYLGQWPNIAKTELTINAVIIATLWAEEPCTLSMAAQKLNIPQREVFSFLSAAAALDLIKYCDLYIEPEYRIGSVDKVIKKQALQKDSLFSRVMTKIRCILGFKNGINIHIL